jgi:hypothetical protein
VTRRHGRKAHVPLPGQRSGAVDTKASNSA